MERFRKGPVHRPGEAILAGLVYGAGMFLLGCALGVVRTLLVEPRSGALVAVLAEVPLLLAASWAFCGRLVYRFGVPQTLVDRGLMGLAGGALLMLGEAEFAILLDRVSVPDSGNRTAARLVGQVGQAGFVLMPLLRLWAGPPTGRRSLDRD